MRIYKANDFEGRGLVFDSEENIKLGIPHKKGLLIWLVETVLNICTYEIKTSCT
jgi:hypothetical protein